MRARNQNNVHFLRQNVCSVTQRLCTSTRGCASLPYRSLSENTISCFPHALQLLIFWPPGGCPIGQCKFKSWWKCVGFPSKTPFDASRQGLQKCFGVFKKYMLAISFLNEMLEDPYCFCRSHVRRYLVRFFEIPKDSHDPLMRMSSCASRGDKNHQGSSSSATRNCFWPDTFVRNRFPA